MTDLQFQLDWDSKLPPSAQEGMHAADEHAAPDWKHWFDGCVLAAAKKKSEIVSDDVLAELEALPDPPSTHNLAAIGPAMQRAWKMGILAPTNETRRSQRPEKHGNRQAVWISRIYTGVNS